MSAFFPAFFGRLTEVVRLRLTTTVLAVLPQARAVGFRNKARPQQMPLRLGAAGTDGNSGGLLGSLNEDGSGGVRVGGDLTLYADAVFGKVREQQQQQQSGGSSASNAPAPRTSANRQLGWRPKQTINSCGSTYEGQWNVVSNRRHGHGVEQSKFEDFVYEGELFENLYHGRGAMRWSNGASYEGEFYKNLKHGFGHEVYASGASEYIGEISFNDNQGVLVSCFIGYGRVQSKSNREIFRHLKSLCKKLSLRCC